MINFTGQTRKRVVNLGNRRGARSGSFLEQTKNQRLERESIKQNEKAARTLQGYIRRYLFMRNIRNQLLDEWKISDVLNPRWISLAYLIFKWSKITNYELELYLEHIIKTIINNKSNLENLPVQSRITLVALFEKMIGLIDLQSQSTEKTIHNIFNSLSLTYYLEYNYEYIMNKIIAFILLDQGNYLISLNCKKEAIECSFVIAANNPLLILNILLGLDGLDLSTIHNILTLPKIILMANSDPDLFGQFSNFQIIDLLVIFLSVHGLIRNNFNLEDMECIVTFLRRLPVSIYEKDYDEEYDNMEDIEVRLEDNKNIQVSTAKYQALRLLYDREFAFQLFKFTQSEGQSYLFEIISTLSYLLPQFTNTFFMYATLYDGIYLLIYKKIVDNPLFNEFLTKDIEGTYSLQGITSYTKDLNQKKFWNLVYALESLYSYWLIISHDSNVFLDKSLSTDQLLIFLKFLKNISLYFIFSDTPNEFNRIKYTSISLLDQLYIKNSKANFIEDENFWTLPNFDFNPSSLTSIIIQIDTSRKEAEDNETVFNISLISCPPIILSKIELLNKLPFFVPFKTRVSIFQSLLNYEKDNDNFFSFHDNRRDVRIHREHSLLDAFKALRGLGNNLKYPLRVTFYNDYEDEVGIDGGGLTKEFLSSVIMEGFNPQNDLHLFSESPGNHLYPNKDLYFKRKFNINIELTKEKLEYYRFLGNIIGKCFFENVLIDISFAPFFLSKWSQAQKGNTSLKSSIDDLKNLDGEMYNNLMKLLEMNNEQIESLDLNFTLDDVVDGETFTTELLPGGLNIKVNGMNKLNYIHLIADFKLNTLLHLQTKYFMAGLFELIPSNWLAMFYPGEIQMLILGSESDVNVQDWKTHVVYSGGYYEEDPTILNFWEVVNEMTPEERFKLLKFSTLVLRAPLLGFGSLNPVFAILRAESNNNTRLPTASTCVNLLKLPDYVDKETMREKILYSINTDAGFDLS